MSSEGDEGGEGSGAESGAGGGTARVAVRYCAVYTCLNNYKTHPQLAYFSIPSAPKRRLKWLKQIHRMDILKNGKVSGYHRVCEAHFRPEDVRARAGGRARLAPRAAPALLLPRGERFVAVNDAPPPRAPRAASPPRAPPPPAAPPPAAPPPAPRVRALAVSRVEVFQYVDRTPRRPATGRSRSGVEPVERRRPASLASLLPARARQPAPGGEACAALLARAPAAYRALAPALRLPPPRALRRPLLRLHAARPLELLRLRAARLSPEGRLCTVGLHFVDVRPHVYYDIAEDRVLGLHEVDGLQEPRPARRCAVLTARALCGAWTQPVALAQLARPPGPDDAALHAWVDDALRRALAAGLRVRALVVPPDAPRPGPHAARPAFDVDGHEILLMYDPPRLMRLLLCRLIERDFRFEGTVARWDDVVRYRELEGRRPLTLTPRLPRALTGPAAPRLARALRPRRAARALADPLAAALADLAERGALGPGASATVKLVLRANGLFEALDSSPTGAGRGRGGGPAGDPAAAGLLAYASSFFGGLELTDRSGIASPDSGEFAERWRVTIATVLALREELAGLGRRLYARRTHVDDRVARAARRAAREAAPAGRVRRPTCRDAVAAFERRLFADTIRAADEETPVDLDDFLARASPAGEPAPAACAGGLAPAGEAELAVRPRDYRAGWRGRSAAGAAARLLRAARRAHGGCAAAGPAGAALPRLLRRLDAALRAALGGPRAARALLAGVLRETRALAAAPPCPCFPLTGVKRLFLRMRLYDILRHNRAEFDRCGDDVEFHLVALE